MKFLLDANIPYSSSGVFKSLGHEAIHVSDVGLARSSDEQIIRYAKRTQSIIVTRDMDFGALVVYHKMSAYGIVILKLPFTSTASSINVSLKVFLETVDPSNLTQSLVVVEGDRYRIRKL
jgi:predicted nuclease of predicted toxin-antitoxin system